MHWYFIKRLFAFDRARFIAAWHKPFSALPHCRRHWCLQGLIGKKVIFREIGYFARADGSLIWKIGVEKEIPFEELSPPNAIPLYRRKGFFKTCWRGELHLLLALTENECSWEKVGWRAAYLNLWIGFCYWEGDKGEVGRERGREAKDGIMLK